MKPASDSLSNYASIGGTSAKSSGKKVGKKVELPVRSEMLHEWGESASDSRLLRFIPEYPSVESAPTAVFKRTPNPARIIIVPKDSHDREQQDIVIDIDISPEAFDLLDNRLQEHVSTLDLVDDDDYDRSASDLIFEREKDEAKFLEVCELIPTWEKLSKKHADIASAVVVRDKRSDAGDVYFLLRNHRNKKLETIRVPADGLPLYITEKLCPDTQSESKYLKSEDPLLYDYTETLNPRKTAETWGKELRPVIDQEIDKPKDDKNFESGVYVRRRDGDKWELCTFKEGKLIGFKAAIFDEESGRITLDIPESGRVTSDIQESGRVTSDRQESGQVTPDRQENSREIGYACDVQDSQGEKYRRVYHGRGWAVREDVEDFSLVNAMSAAAHNKRSSPQLVIFREDNISNALACQAFENLEKIPKGHVRAIFVTGLPNEGATSPSADGREIVSSYDSLADLKSRQGYILAAWAGEHLTIVNRDKKPELFAKVAAAVEDFNDIHTWIVREKKGEEMSKVPKVDICFSPSIPDPVPLSVPSNELDDSVVMELLPRESHVLAVLDWMGGERRVLRDRVDDAIAEALYDRERDRADSELSLGGGSGSEGLSEQPGSEYEGAAGERESAPPRQLQRAFWQETPRRRADPEILKRAMESTESSRAKQKPEIQYTALKRGSRSG